MTKIIIRQMLITTRICILKLPVNTHVHIRVDMYMRVYKTKSLYPYAHIMTGHIPESDTFRCRLVEIEGGRIILDGVDLVTREWGGGWE